MQTDLDRLDRARSRRRPRSSTQLRDDRERLEQEHQRSRAGLQGPGAQAPGTGRRGAGPRAHACSARAARVAGRAARRRFDESKRSLKKAGEAGKLNRARRSARRAVAEIARRRAATDVEQRIAGRRRGRRWTPRTSCRSRSSATAYTIRGEADQEYILGVAAYVDRKMREITEKLPVASLSKVAILASSNIADELFKERAPGQTSSSS